jgi:glycosyltransferase involved in cell wall biosynthesis
VQPSSSAPKVVYWFNQPTPYVVNRFNAVAKRPEIQFEAWFSEVRQADRSWAVDPGTWAFRARYLTVHNVARAVLRVPAAELFASRPDLFVLEYDRLNLALGAVLGRLLAGRVAFRVLPNFDAWSERTWWREASKHLLFRAIDAAKVPGPDGAALAGRYGLPCGRRWRVRQSIDVDHYGSSRAVSRSVREQRRAELGLEGCVYCFVGRLWSGKGIDELFNAYRRLSAETTAISLLMVGDGVDEARYRRAAKDLPNVVFAGFIQPSELPAWYALADVLVFPTRGDPNGLVIEEALAAGLPVIVSDAAGDVASRVPKAVGHIVPGGSVAALADSMTTLLDDRVRVRLAAAAPGLVRDKDDEGYADDFVKFALGTLGVPPRRGLFPAVCGCLGRIVSIVTRLAGWRPAPPVE